MIQGVEEYLKKGKTMKTKRTEEGGVSEMKFPKTSETEIPEDW